jgi:phosphomannomutase
LEELGCRVIRVHCAGTGVFPHVAEPLPEHLGDLCHAVRIHNADMGFAVDPDADRLVLIDEKGNAVWEEYTITIATLSACVFAETFGAQYERTAVVNLSTTRAVEDIMQAFGGSVQRSAVGEINVVQTIRATNALIGGEGSGGVVLPASHAGRDSLVGAALVLALCCERKQSLSEIIAGLPRYAMVKNKVEFQGDVQVILRAVSKQFSHADMNWGDGLRLSFEAERAWVHLRASNTEPIMRVISEAPDQAHATALSEQCMQIVRSFL